MVRVDIITNSGTSTIAEQGLAGYEIIGCVVKSQLNQISACTLNFPATNKQAEVLMSGFSSVVDVYYNDRRVFIGSVASAKKDIFGNIEASCDGALSWLSDIVKPPFYVNNKTHAQYIQAIIDQYNAAMTANGTEERIIWFGGVTGFNGNVDIHHSDEYVNTLDLLREAVEMYGGFFFEVYGGVTAKPSFGWMKQPTVSSGQVLEFGVNELTLEDFIDFSDFATRVYGRNSDGLTVSGGYLANADAEAQYGRRDYAFSSDAETQAALDAEASAILTAKSVPVLRVELSALEVSRLGANIGALQMGTTAKAIDRKLGYDLELMVNTVERDYIDLRNSHVVLGRPSELLTDNIGGSSSGSGVSSGSGGGAVQNAVLYTIMNLTSSEKAVARNNIGAAETGSIPTKVSDLTNDLNFINAAGAADAAPVKSVNGKTGSVILKTSDLQNDSGYITSVPVTSVNGKTGAVVLDAEDVGALPDDTFIPTKTSQLENDAHFVTEIEAGVTSVNGQTGDVLLTTSDISNTSGYITANDVPQEVPTADASANGMVLGVDNGRYTFVRMTGGISDVTMDGASIVQSGTTIAAIPKANTTRFGVVKLYDGSDSTSTSLVPTANALRGVGQRVGNLETRSANWLTETQIKELIDSMVQEQIAMYQRRVFALEDNKEDIDITSLSDLTSHDILYGEHWKQIGTNNNYGAVLYNPESKTIGGSSSDLIYLKRGYIIGVSKNSWFVTSDQNWYCSHVFLSYPKMQAVYAYDEENNIRYIAADIPAEIVEQAKVLAEDFLSQIESLETEI